MINLGYDPMIIKYQGIVFSLVSKYANPKDLEEVEDLVMAGCEGLFYAIKTFNKKKNASLSTWIWINARDYIQREKNSSLVVTVSCPTARKHNITLYKGKEGQELMRQEEFNKAETETPLTLLMDKDDEYDRIRKYNEAWRKLNRKFSNMERLVIIDYYVHNKSFRHLNTKYKINNAFDIISRVKTILNAQKQG